MKLKIISDGTPQGTKVVDQETGNTVENITQVTWELGVGDISSATIKIVGIPAEITGETKSHECSCKV